MYSSEKSSEECWNCYKSTGAMTFHEYRNHDNLLPT